MALRDITSASAVRKAIREFDRLGADSFLDKYGFGPAKLYHLLYEDVRYPSKAIIGVAHGYQFLNKGPLESTDFSGGETAAVPKLKALGFEIVRIDDVVRPGDVLSNAELSQRFSVGNMGGMRRSKKQNHLVLISDPTKGLYDDRWEGDTLHYTGMGMTGDQSFTNQNRTLSESWTTGITIHLFEVFTSAEYTYVGEMSLADEPYHETQLGVDGNQRRVIMFPLKLRPGAYRTKPARTAIERLAAARSDQLSKKPLSELRKRAELSNKSPQRREITTIQIARDQTVVEYVKKAAKGTCDLCAQQAPFKDSKGRPYLECHHVIRLADDGDDSISNAVALCANCHRKMHVLNKKVDREILREIILQRDR